jgi:1,4-dihydroxy-2-naphthoate octaprenyltransferase
MAVSTGLTISYWKSGTIDPVYATLTYVGVVSLHASVDLFNDYWDYKRGIDFLTKRTKLSGGTGVLTDKLLTPKAVYIAGVAFMILGAAIGVYFVTIRGIAIAVILAFAIIAISFYSTSIVNLGLSEFFVALKGCMIVLGTFYVQTGYIDPAAIYSGAIVGIMSAAVLFINSFPDYEADKSKGRRTLVILMGRKMSSSIFPLFVGAVYALILAGIFLGLVKMYAILTFASFPLAVKGIRSLQKNFENDDKLFTAMTSIVSYSRLTGLLLAISYLI